MNSFYKQMLDMTGYQPITTFYNDFDIAEAFSKEAILDTFNRAFKEWKDHYIYLTELVMMLNWKSWEHNSYGNYEVSELYADLFYKARDYGYDHLKDDELSYFWRTLD